MQDLCEFGGLNEVIIINDWALSESRKYGEQKECENETCVLHRDIVDARFSMVPRPKPK